MSIAKEFAEKILKEYKDIYFIIAGKESKEISPLKDSHWIEVGWTEEGKKIIKNSQLYILPNRETYFDLVFLEALSLILLFYVVIQEEISILKNIIPQI